MNNLANVVPAEEHGGTSFATEGSSCPCEGAADVKLGELIRHAQIIELQPDDVLVISNAGPIPPEHAARIRQALDDARPGTKCIIFPEDINLDILRNLQVSQ